MTLKARQHTAGPWRNNSGLIYAECSDPSHTSLGDYCSVELAAIIPSDGGITEIDIANARLIAAAPELLDVALMVTEWLTADPDVRHQVKMKAYAAITKAVS